MLLVGGSERRRRLLLLLLFLFAKDLHFFFGELPPASSSTWSIAFEFTVDFVTLRPFDFDAVGTDIVFLLSW